MHTVLFDKIFGEMYPLYPHVLEFGVAEGESLRYINKNIQSSYKIFGFDSFEGLPEDWIGTECKKGCFSTEGRMPDINGVIFYKGWFENSIIEYIKDGAKPISLLHIDCDLYSSTKTILNNLIEFIGPNTIIVFDEWYYNYNYKCNDGEHKAFFEWVVNNDISFDFIATDLNYYNQDIINNTFAINQRAVKIIYNKKFKFI